MGIFESIKKGFSVACSSLPVVGVTFIFGLIFNLINLAIGPQADAPNAPPSPAMIVSAILFIILTIFMQAGSMGYIRDSIKQGRAAFSVFVQSGIKNYIRIFILSMIIALIIFIFAVLAAVAGGLLTKISQPAAIAAVIAIFLVGIFILVLLFFAPYIAVNESKGVIASLGDSVKLVRANKLKVVLISVILIAIVFAAGRLIIGAGVDLLSRVIPADAGKIVIAVSSSLASAFLGLFWNASFMSFYLSRSTPLVSEGTVVPQS